jgi:hypothetical protein
MSDPINPSHYKTRGVEAIEICEHLDFCLGNAVKYLWRTGLKDPALQDLKKAAWYLRRAERSVVEWPNEDLQVLLPRVMRAEPEGSVLCDVLRYLFTGTPRIADALARVERAIEEVTHA